MPGGARGGELLDGRDAGQLVEADEPRAEHLAGGGPLCRFAARFLDSDIFAYVAGRVRDLGLEVLGVGVKDVILPGEMKDILNSVVQAEKAAQANVIRRRGRRTQPVRLPTRPS